MIPHRINEVIIMDENISNCDSAEALLEKYDRRRLCRKDDVTAMQAVICILIAALMFAANIRFPKQTGELYCMIRSLALEGGDIVKNPIDAVVSLF